MGGTMIPFPIELGLLKYRFMRGDWKFKRA
jgi:hypothetical protein